MSIIDCDCHPKKSFLGFRFYAPPYADAMQWGLAGKVCIKLARPRRGFHLHGWYLFFGRVFVSFTPFLHDATK